MPSTNWGMDVWGDAVLGTTMCPLRHSVWWHSHGAASPQWPPGALASHRSPLLAAYSLC